LENRDNQTYTFSTFKENPSSDKYDKYYFPEKPKGTFDTILCFYVLNVIPADEREEVIKEIGKYLKPKGKVIFAVRTPAEIEREAKRGEWRYVGHAPRPGGRGS